MIWELVISLRARYLDDILFMVFFNVNLQTNQNEDRRSVRVKFTPSNALRNGKDVVH